MGWDKGYEDPRIVQHQLTVIALKLDRIIVLLEKATVSTVVAGVVGLDGKVQFPKEVDNGQDYDQELPPQALP